MTREAGNEDGDAWGEDGVEVGGGSLCKIG